MMRETDRQRQTDREEWWGERFMKGNESEPLASQPVVGAEGRVSE